MVLPVGYKRSNFNLNLKTDRSNMPSIKRTFSGMSFSTGYAAKRTKASRPRFTRGRRGKSNSRNYIARIAQQVVNRNVEWKYHDITASTTIDNAGAVACLSLVPQGDTDTTRDGDHLRATSLRVNYVLESNTSTPGICRIIFFQWADDTTNSPPTVAAVMEATTPYSVVSHDYASRMKILSDEMHVVDNTSSKSIPQRMKLQIPHQQIQFAGGTTQHTQGIWFLVLSDITPQGSPPTFKYFARLNFSDA